MIFYRHKMLDKLTDMNDDPRWWLGICWDDFYRREVVYTLIGLNVIARWVRHAWLWLRYRPASGISRLVEEHELFISENNRLLGELRKERERTELFETRARVEQSIGMVAIRLWKAGFTPIWFGRASGQPNVFIVHASRAGREWRAAVAWQEMEGKLPYALEALFLTRFEVIEEQK